MDLTMRARALVAAVANGEGLEPFLSEDARCDADGIERDRDGTVRHWKKIRAAWHDHELECQEVLVRRNVVVVSWAWRDGRGHPVYTGSWVLSFDRTGRVTHWSSV